MSLAKKYKEIADNINNPSDQTHIDTILKLIESSANKGSYEIEFCSNGRGKELKENVLLFFRNNGFNISEYHGDYDYHLYTISWYEKV